MDTSLFSVLDIHLRGKGRITYLNIDLLQKNTC